MLDAVGRRKSLGMEVGKGTSGSEVRERRVQDLRLGMLVAARARARLSSRFLAFFSIGTGESVKGGTTSLQ